jgi:NAD-dependent deacetylase
MIKKKMVVLTGAGISAESGLKTFRDSDGLWEGYPVETVATPQAWKNDPQLVLDFYNARRRDIAMAKPNLAHEYLAGLEKKFDVTIITQNIDDLHERAGSTNIVHLHGGIFRMCSERDRSGATDIREDMHLELRAPDGSRFRPDIVWFGEPVPAIEKAIVITMEADLFVVIGTSLQVYPAAGLLEYAPPYARKFLIDKKAPSSQMPKDVIFIEKPATEGVLELGKLI